MAESHFITVLKLFNCQTYFFPYQSYSDELIIGTLHYQNKTSVCFALLIKWLMGLINWENGFMNELVVCNRLLLQ